MNFPSSSDNTCWMYLLRHGATANNLARPVRLQGRRSDPGLSPEGVSQAEAAADFLRTAPIDSILSSPLLRARETAAPISRSHQHEIEIVDGLIEVDVGHWEGISWESIEVDYPEEYARFVADPASNGYHGGETLDQVAERVVPCILEILEANVGRSIAVAAHNMVNRIFIAEMLGVPRNNYRNIPQDNCGINIVRYKDGKVKVATINSTWHLNGGS